MFVCLFPSLPKCDISFSFLRQKQALIRVKKFKKIVEGEKGGGDGNGLRGCVGKGCYRGNLGGVDLGNNRRTNYRHVCIYIYFFFPRCKLVLTRLRNNIVVFNLLNKENLFLSVNWPSLPCTTTR